jgi:hypothetical protein
MKNDNESKLLFTALEAPLKEKLATKDVYVITPTVTVSNQGRVISTPIHTN